MVKLIQLFALLLIICLPLFLSFVANDCDPKWEISSSGNFQINQKDCSMQLFSHTDRMELLRNKYIILIGDSLSRYQYVNLIHYILYDRCPSNYPRVEHEKEWNDWEAFHRGSNLRFGCSEICDCFHTSWNDNTENRYFYDEKYNFSISFHYWNGKSIWIERERTFFDRNPNTRLQRLNPCSNLTDFKTALTRPYQKYGIKYNNIVDFIHGEIKLFPPNYLFLNFGLWDPTYWLDKSNLTAMVDLYKQLRTIMGERGHIVWKTTTSRRGIVEDGIDTVQLLDAYKNIGFDIFDTFFFTKNLVNMENAFWDTIHYTASVYCELNFRLFEFIKKLEM
jgi:hypothetical protein